MITLTEALVQRDFELDDLRFTAIDLLRGQTILDVRTEPHLQSCDSPNVLRLLLGDGTTVDITGGYGGYSGHSCDEYVETVTVAAGPPITEVYEAEADDIGLVRR